MSTALPRKRLLALCAALALIACSAVYSAHGLGDRNHEHAHCDLCVHFAGSAGSPAKATVAGKPILAVRMAPALPAQPMPAGAPFWRPLPRGPPAPI